MNKFTKLLWSLLVMAGILVPLTIYAAAGDSIDEALEVNVNNTNVKTLTINGVEVTLTTKLENLANNPNATDYAIVYTWDLSKNTDGKIPVGTKLSVNSLLTNQNNKEQTLEIAPLHLEVKEDNKTGIVGIGSWVQFEKSKLPESGIYSLDVEPTVTNGETPNKLEKYLVYLNLDKGNNKAKPSASFPDTNSFSFEVDKDDEHAGTLSFNLNYINNDNAEISKIVLVGVTNVGLDGVTYEKWGNDNIMGSIELTNVDPGQIAVNMPFNNLPNPCSIWMKGKIILADNTEITIPELGIGNIFEKIATDPDVPDYTFEVNFTEEIGSDYIEVKYDLTKTSDYAFPEGATIEYYGRMGFTDVPGKAGFDEYFDTASGSYKVDGLKPGEGFTMWPNVGDWYVKVNGKEFRTPNIVFKHNGQNITDPNITLSIPADQPEDPNKPAHGEAVNTVNGTIWALRMKADNKENEDAIAAALDTSLEIGGVTDDAYTSFDSNTNNILWRSPLADVSEEEAGGKISGGYSGAHTSGKTWKGELKNIPFTISNDKDGYIFGELDLTDIKIPTGLVITAYINNVPCPAVVKDNKASFETKYGYVNGKIVSFHFYYAFLGGGNATTLTYQYTITKGVNETEALKFDDLFSYESNHYSEFDVKEWNKNERADFTRDNIPANCDWAHTARPAEIDIWDSWKADKDESIGTENVTATYWNPPFKFRVFNQASEENADEVKVPVGIALEFKNGTVIPANFVPSFALQKIQCTKGSDGTITIEPQGKAYSYNMTTLGSVVNMFAGTTDPETYPARKEPTATPAPQKAAGDPEKFVEGDYWLSFRFDYTSIVDGRGFSLTRDFVITLNNSDITTGIEGVDVEAAEVAPVYFNLQGMRVEKPAKGQIVIMVQGKKATKVMF